VPWANVLCPQIPEEEVLVQEVLRADVAQGEDGVDSHKQSPVDRDQLQPLQAGGHGRQGQGAGLPQPVHEGLEAEKGPFEEHMEGWEGEGDGRTVFTETMSGED